MIALSKQTKEKEMKTPHIHAEITIAWLNDQSIKLEFKRPLPGAVWEVTYGFMNPISNPEYNWRRKPEPKPDFVMYCNPSVTDICHFTYTQWACDTVKFTFDGETGKPIKAEIIK